MAALSTNLAVLVVARVIQGVGMATQALSIGIIATYWRGEGMRRAMSMIIVAIGLGAVVGFLWVGSYGGAEAIGAPSSGSCPGPPRSPSF